DLLSLRTGGVVVVDRRSLRLRRVEWWARRHAPLLPLSDSGPSVTADSANPKAVLIVTSRSDSIPTGPVGSVCVKLARFRTLSDGPGYSPGRHLYAAICTTARVWRRACASRARIVRSA